VTALSLVTTKAKKTSFSAGGKRFPFGGTIQETLPAFEKTLKDERKDGQSLGCPRKKKGI